MSETWNKEDNYAAVDHLHDDKYSKLGHTHTDTPDHNHDTVYSKLGHNHNDAYSKLGHSHSEFSLTSHNHDTTYSKLGHDHDDTYPKLGHVHDYAATDHNHDDVYSKLGHSHELIDMLPVGTVLWFKSNVTLSNKWTVYTDLIGRYPLGATSNLGNSVEPALPNIKTTKDGYDAVITGSINAAYDITDGPVRAFYYGTVNTGGGEGQDTIMRLAFDASLCSSVYKDDCDTVTPPSVNLIPYIKIA